MSEKKKSTKELILQTACSLFQRQGYRGTGLNQIIEESGAPKGSLYYHFPNGKEEMAKEAIHLMKEHVLEHVQMDLSGKNSALEAFQYHISQVADLFDRTEEMEGLPIGLIASETASTNQSLRQACEQAYQEWQLLYAEHLKAFGFEQKEAEALSVTINALLEGGCILSITNGSGEPLRMIAGQLAFLLSREKKN